MGDNKHFGGGKGHKRPKMTSPESAPAGFGVLEGKKPKKKRKIRVKINKKQPKIDEKKRKKRKKRGKNTRKKHYHWNVGDWNYGGGYGDSGGDGGGE